jgi:putative hydrolase of the HAD superfamily
MLPIDLTSDVHWHFDFDGTLFFTHAALLSSYEESIVEYGGRFSTAAKDSLVRGESYKTFLDLCSWKDIDFDPEIIRNRKNEIYLSNIDQIRPNPSLISAAVSMFPHISIVTSSSRVLVETILTHFELGKYFKNIVASDDVIKIKPSPEPYLKSISKFPGAIHIAVEDSELGLIAAQAAGLLVLRTGEFSS